MAMKKVRKDVGWNETWAEFRKGCRKYHVKFWKKTCPWYCRPRQCVKAFLMMKKDESTRENRNFNILLRLHYDSRDYVPKKRWQ